MYVHLYPGPPTGGETGVLCPGSHSVGGPRKTSFNGPHIYFHNTFTVLYHYDELYRLRNAQSTYDYTNTQHKNSKYII